MSNEEDSMEDNNDGLAPTRAEAMRRAWSGVPHEERVARTDAARRARMEAFESARARSEHYRAMAEKRWAAERARRAEVAGA
ncbi:hypothetical protein [Nocardioides zeae]